MSKVWKNILTFLLSLHLKFIILLGIFCVLCAIINNIRVPEENSVEWIGAQDVLAKPEDIL